MSLAFQLAWLKGVAVRHGRCLRLPRAAYTRRRACNWYHSAAKWHHEKCELTAHPQNPSPQRWCLTRDCGRAWRGSGEHPFLLDNVYDLQRLLDYLEARPDVDPRRMGVTGVSLGGMHAWLLAALDERLAAAAPMIGVQVCFLITLYV